MSSLSKKNNKKYNRKYSRRNKYNMLGGMKLLIKSLNKTRTTTFEISPDDTVDSLRSMIANKMGIELNKLVLFYNDNILENGNTINDYGIVDDSEITTGLLVECSNPSSAALPIKGSAMGNSRWCIHKADLIDIQAREESAAAMEGLSLVEWLRKENSRLRHENTELLRQLDPTLPLYD
jgi:hypothetical protein